MLKEVLQSIEGIAIFPFIGLFIFVFAFLVVIANTLRMKKSEVEYAGRLPFDDGTVDTVPGSGVSTEDRRGDDS